MSITSYQTELCKRRSWWQARQSRSSRGRCPASKFCNGPEKVSLRQSALELEQAIRAVDTLTVREPSGGMMQVHDDGLLLACTESIALWQWMQATCYTMQALRAGMREVAAVIASTVQASADAKNVLLPLLAASTM